MHIMHNLFNKITEKFLEKKFIFRLNSKRKHIMKILLLIAIILIFCPLARVQLRIIIMFKFDIDANHFKRSKNNFSHCNHLTLTCQSS